MRIYKNLNKKTKEDLLRLLDQVKAHPELIPEEKEENIKLIHKELDKHNKKEKLIQEIKENSIGELSDPDNGEYYT